MLLNALYWVISIDICFWIHQSKCIICFQLTSRPRLVLFFYFCHVGTLYLLPEGSAPRAAAALTTFPGKIAKPGPLCMSHGEHTAWPSLQPSHQLAVPPAPESSSSPGRRLMGILLTGSAFARTSLGVATSRPWPWRVLGRLEDYLKPLGIYR